VSRERRDLLAPVGVIVLDRIVSASWRDSSRSGGEEEGRSSEVVFSVVRDASQ